MNICGVELAGSDAVICMLGLEQGRFTLPECKVRKLTLKKNHTREDLLEFQASFLELMTANGVSKVAIKERMPKGKFAGGAISFKLEATIQLISRDVDVTLVSPSRIKATLAANPVPIDFADTGLKVFQEAAFLVAYAEHMTK